MIQKQCFRIHFTSLSYLAGSVQNFSYDVPRNLHGHFLQKWYQMSSSCMPTDYNHVVTSSCFLLLCCQKCFLLPNIREQWSHNSACKELCREESRPIYHLYWPLGLCETTCGVESTSEIYCPNSSTYPSRSLCIWGKSPLQKYNLHGLLIHNCYFTYLCVLTDW